MKIITIPNLMRNLGEVYLDTDFRRYGKKRDLVPILRGYPLRYGEGSIFGVMTVGWEWQESLKRHFATRLPEVKRVLYLVLNQEIGKG